MSVNKVSYFGNVLIDLTGDTVTPDTLSKGITAHDKSGNAIVGTNQGGGMVIPTPTPGDYPVLVNHTVVRRNQTSLGDVGLTLTVPVSGTYRIKWTAFRTNNSNTFGTRIYVNGSAKGTEVTTWTNTYYQANQLDLALNKGDVVSVYCRSRSTSYYIFVSDLSLCVADNGFSQL